MNTLNHMQVMARTLHAWTLPTMGSIPGGAEFDQDGSFKDQKLQERFENMGKKLVQAANLFQSNKIKR